VRKAQTGTHREAAPEARVDGTSAPLAPTLRRTWQTPRIACSVLVFSAFGATARLRSISDGDLSTDLLTRVQGRASLIMPIAARVTIARAGHHAVATQQPSVRGSRRVSTGGRERSCCDGIAAVRQLRPLR